MAEQHEKKVVNGLVVACEDGAEAFRSALKEVEDRDLKQLFYDLSIEREHTAAELRKLMYELGGQPKEIGSASGFALRLFADLKAALSSNEENAVLEELERSEDRILGRFESALDEPLPAAIRETLHACQSEVMASRKKIGALREQMADRSR